MRSPRRSFARRWPVIRAARTAAAMVVTATPSLRPLTDLPVAGYPLMLQVAVPRYRCITPGCGRAVFNQDLGKLAAPRSSYDASVCPVCVAAVDDRPHHHLGHRRRIGRVLAYRQHDRDAHDRRPDRRGRAGSAGRSAGDRRRRAPLGAPARRRRRVRHADHRFDPDPRSQRPRAAAGPGARSFSDRAGVMVGCTTRRLRRRRAGHRDGRVRRLQDRRHRGHPGCGHRDGPLPRRRAGRDQARPDPPTHPTADPRPARTHRRPALRDPPHRPHPPAAALHPPVRPADQRFRHRRTPRGQSRLADLSEDHRRLRRHRTDAAARTQ